MIRAYLNGVELPPLEVPFLRVPLEHSTDVEPLDGSLYTDFVAINDRWEMSWATLTQAEYDVIDAIYRSQRTTRQYPLLSIPFFGVTDVSARMTLNTKDIWNHCGDVKNVTITLRETRQLSGEGESS